MILSKSAGSDLQPPIIQYFNKFDGKLWYAENGYPHPLPGLSVGWRRVTTALEEVLDLYETVREEKLDPSSSSKSRGKNTDKLLERHQELVYRAVEFVETAADKTKFALLPPERLKDRWEAPRVKGLRRHADIICNRLKHNQHQLVGVTVSHPQSRVEGYMVTHISPSGEAVPNRDIHKDREAFSLNVDVRKIVANCYLVSQEVVHVAESMTGTKMEPLDGADPETEIALRRLCDLPLFVFPGETAKHMPILSFDGEALSIEDRGGHTRHSMFGHHYETRYMSDGHTRSFHIPFMAGHKN
ncbi:hypothetical protein ASF70_07510 [Rhizobium sp. Leaf321]|uniref:hypothetical protein n=1 Tax=Rhizobium sp. Leaf321 TaxID=1736335 RepID=UPI0007128642|nr:hypothetical protein [Rhizobium sp. Leaf321]KQQ73650.1 hypothetical protein ASF70_07510 [Rhizobium sp. Leaf321]